jgi:quercetin dioxygenase-like cupin family protein
MSELNYAEMKKNTAVTMNANKILKTHINRNRKTITCLQGKIWVTQEGDLADHVLSAGDEMVTRKDGVVLIQAMGNAAIKIEPSYKKPLLH